MTERLASNVDEADAVYAAISELVGRQDGPPRRAIGVVSADRIRDWCEAIGETNPIHLDREAARAAGYDDIVCPPAALMLWTMAGLRNQAAAIVGPEGLRVRQLLREAGYPGTLAVNCDQEYVRYLRLGERVVVSAVIGPVSPRKETGLGAGYFHSLLLTYSTDGGEVVGRVTMRTLSFKPRPRPNETKNPAAAGDARVAPTMNPDTAFFWEGAKAGTLLIQCCKSCGKLRSPPEPMCPHCNSLEWSAQAAAGGGAIHSYVVMHHPKLPGFKPPYAIGLIDLDEGVRVVAGLTAPLDRIKIGRRVKVAFRDFGDFAVPDFELDADSAA